MSKKRMARALSRRAVIAAASALAFTTTAAQAQSGLGTAEKPIEVRMIANEAFASQWQNAMVPEFNKAFPHIKVRIDGVPYVELLAKTMLDATGPSPTYDIFIADDPWIPQLATVGALLDLKSPEVQKWTAADYDWADFNSAPLAAGDWKGVQYGVPLRSNMLMMFVNKTHFEKAGLPAPTPALTWQQFLEQAPKLVRDTNGDGKPDVWAIDTYFIREPLTPTIWQAILNANGGSLLDDKGKPAFNNKIGIEALETHKKLLDFAPTGAISHGFSESMQAFRQGVVATLINWGSIYKGSAIDPKTTTLKPEEVSIQVLPGGSSSAGSHRGIWNGSVSAKSQNKQAAWAVLQWLSSKQGEAWHAAALGVFPARKSTLASNPPEPWLKPVFAALQQSYDAAEKGKMWRIRHPRSDAAQQILADEVARFMAGKATAAEALQTAAGKIEKVLN